MYAPRADAKATALVGEEAAGMVEVSCEAKAVATVAAAQNPVTTTGSTKKPVQTQGAIDLRGVVPLAQNAQPRAVDEAGASVPRVTRKHPTPWGTMLRHPPATAELTATMVRAVMSVNLVATAGRRAEQTAGLKGAGNAVDAGSDAPWTKRSQTTRAARCLWRRLPAPKET